MGFRDFITSRWFRRRMDAALQRYRDIRPPANPSKRYIYKLVRRLLSEKTAWHARKELSMIGEAAVPSLADALADPRFHEAEWPEYSQVPAPLESVLELLVPHGGDYVLRSAMPLISSPSNEVRKTAALNLASLGSVQTIPVLAKLLQDSDGYVRSYVCIGIDRAASGGRASEEFRHSAYDLLLVQCDQEWSGTLNDAARTVVALDSRRAKADFASARWLSPTNEYTYRILQACNDADIALPETLIQPLLDYALPLAVGDKCYPNQYLAAAALESLVISTGERARPQVDALLTHKQAQIREAAGRGVLRLAGLRDPILFVFDQLKRMSFAELSMPQRVVYCAHMFDAEVCNGGIMQFFGNSSGDYAMDTLDALRELAHPEAETALASAMKLIGPLAREADRDMRLSAFEGRYEELQAAFGPLEDAYYRTDALLRQKILLYAVSQSEHFRD